MDTKTAKKGIGVLYKVMSGMSLPAYRLEGIMGMMNVVTI
jgi:hypothetical protein